MQTTLAGQQTTYKTSAQFIQYISDFIAYWGVNTAYQAQLEHVWCVYFIGIHNKHTVVRRDLLRQSPVARHFKVVVPGRRFGKPWLAIYKYNHLYCVEIFGNQKGEGCRKIDTKNESTSRVGKFQTWSHGRPWYSLNFTYEKVDNKMYCVVCRMCGIPNNNYVKRPGSNTYLGQQS